MDFITFNMKHYLLIIIFILKGNQVNSEMSQDPQTDMKEFGEKGSTTGQINADRWKENGTGPAEFAENATGWFNSSQEDCQSRIPNCQRCLTNSLSRNCLGCGSDDIEGEFLKERCIECEKVGDEFAEENMLDIAASSWKCMECEWGYAVTMNQHQCTSCSDTIANCTECYSVDERIVCSLCDQGFYISNETSCIPCDTTIENCKTCQFEGQNRSLDLVCTGCHVGFFFDYYRNCSACNETMPRCTHCSSFEPCQVFGTVQNLTCHSCEENYFVAEDEASCKLDCRNISSHCENCTIAEEDSVCLSCSKNAHQDHDGNCHTCGENITECMECTDASLSEGISCFTCQQGFALHPNNRSCTNCSLTPHCVSCVISERSDGTQKNTCEVCEEGFSWSEPDGVCRDCSDAAEHCGSCHEDGENTKTCTACVRGFTFVGGKCAEIVCGVPPPPPYRGGYAFSGIRYGDTVTYDCECGYDVVGDQILTCGESGQWGQAPCCARKMFDLMKVIQDFSRKDLRDDTVMEHLQSMKDVDVRDLDLSHNRLTYVPFLTYFKQLDSLQLLKMSKNNIQTFSWDDFPANTKEIDLTYNQLNILPVVNKHALCLIVKVLYLRGNKLAYIKNDQIPHSVERLSVWDNNIAKFIDMFHNTNLKYIDLDGNSITEIPPGLPASLTKLELLRNDITDITDMRHLNKLQVLTLQTNKLTTVPKLLPVSLIILNLSFNNLTFIGDLRYLDKLESLDISRNKLTIVPKQLPASLTELYLYSNNLTFIGDLRYLDKLEHLHISKNKLTTVPKQLPVGLIELYLYSNNLTFIGDLRYLDKLEHLHISKNKLTTVAKQLPVSLRRLFMSSNDITSLDGLRFLNKLTHLSLANNKLTRISGLLPKYLLQLDISRNNIGDFENNNKLNMANNNSTISIDNFPESLTHFAVYGSNLSNWKALINLTNLISLDVNANQLVFCPNELLLQITGLSLRGHGEAQISNLTFMTNLRRLSLFNFNITHLPSHFPVMIEDLSVRSNITEFSALSLYENLKTFYIPKFSEPYIPNIYFSRIKNIHYINNLE